LVLCGSFAEDWECFAGEVLPCAEDELARFGLDCDLQIVPFHPKAEYEDSPSVFADFVLRSPYPTVHLLRKADVAAAEEEWARRGRSTADVAAYNTALLAGVGRGELERLARSWHERP